MRPDRIGRYVVEKTLGVGGMGAVYLARDEELQRPVAIKGLLGSDTSKERRERLRREALATASLSHPAIAHVYEIVTQDDRDWLVMEYVEGATLADLVDDGPLAPAEVARIGAAVARALAAAHAQGIVHRDVKPDNVILTPHGDVRVLDFGLAQRTAPDAAASDRLTGDGMVVGTAKSMSPEQALGKTTDHRSDLFSLGSMLFELATGQDAFSGPGPMDIMVKVARNEHPALRKIAPRLPTALVAVIERCMATDPAQRYANADEAAAALESLVDPTGATRAVALPSSLTRVLAPLRKRWWIGAVIAVGLTVLVVAALKSGWLSAEPPLTVAVLPPEVEGDAESLRLASAAVADAVAAHLSRLDGLIVVSGRDVRSAASPDKPLTALATELGVKELVTSSLAARTASDVHIHLERTDGTTLATLWQQDLDTATSDLLLLQDRISTALEDGYRSLSSAGTPASRGASARALALYLESAPYLMGKDSSPGYEREIRLLEEAVADSQGFVEAWVRLVGIHRYLAGVTESSEHLRQAEALLAHLQGFAAGDPRVVTAKADLLAVQGRTDEAVQLVLPMTRRRSGDPEAWATVGRLFAAQSRLDASERALLRSIALLPSARSYVTLARTREQRGDFDGARAAVHEALARSAGNISATSCLAEVEMYAGNNPEAERLYRELLKRRNSRIDLIHLGNAVFYQGRYDEAAELYSKAVARDPLDYLALANLADARFWSGRTEEARALYERALEACDSKEAAGLKERALRETRARSLAQLGRPAEALAALEQMVAQDPEHPGTLFTAALVHALLGDTNSCAAWTQKALEANAPRVWFSGPEFSAMRSNVRFAAILGVR